MLIILLNFFAYASFAADHEEHFRLTTLIMSLPSIKKLTTITGRGHHHLILAVILILKHATFLRLSNLSPDSALTQTDLHYQEANIDLKIKQHLVVSSQKHSVMLFADFIMATDIESTHQDIAPSQSSSEHVHKKQDHWFKRIFPRKLISSPNDK